jgi:hypothetical protein
MNIDVQSTHCKLFVKNKIVERKGGTMNSYLATSEKSLMGSFNYAIIVFFSTTNPYQKKNDDVYSSF